MGMFEEAVSEVAEKLTEVVAGGAGAVTGALGSPSPAEMEKQLKGLPPEARAQLVDVFSDMREEVESQWPKDPEVFRRYVSSPAFDEGIAIVGRYDFGRPRLTEKLTDEVLASYVFLLKGGDPKLTKMFKELSEWQRTLPKPPWAA